ncbi:Mor transcription activator family protein [Levilactobacillus parabrevis]|uniref:Mor transcription activator domain-containing protein n=1 Tax=Levilactobacillus parabrevis ATCC 53295 TaxID=1267003 RepID=A0A0R1GX81_9LACO|nr:Mor transcription activator family protein [Levilactobacillus parabrevis]KRK36113.1 hypothetical protein FD07_GL001095 [Levilactobacillus parabrevis ATCC 53295]KRO05380.1 hypothetical protein IV61_GL001382 [Levilactobacillus parabrevis]
MDDPRNWQALYRELSQVIGRSATRQLYHYFRGMQVSFPQRLLDSHREADLMYQEYCRGSSVTRLAQRHNYSERSVRRILTKFRE